MILPERVLGRPGAHWIRSGRGDRADSPCASHWTSFLAQLLARLLPGDQGDVGVDALALEVVGIADHRRLGDPSRAADQGALDLRAVPHPVARHVDHVVDPPGDPVVAVLVPAAAVAGEVLALEGREIGSARTVRGRRRPCASARASCRRCRGCPSVAALQVMALVVDDHRLDAEEGQRRRPGLQIGRAGQRGESGCRRSPSATRCRRSGSGLPRRRCGTRAIASGLIGSPTEPRMRRLFRLVFLTGPSPSRISARDRGRRG